MGRLVLIVNRRAGQGQADTVVAEARRSFSSLGLEVFHSTDPSETRSLCASLDPASCRGLLLIGGDGTVMQALPAIQGRGIPLGILPGGTANDLAEELGVRLDWERVRAVVERRLVRAIDLASVNGAFFATVAGIGVGAAVTRDYNDSRTRSPLVRGAARVMRSRLYTALAAKHIALGGPRHARRLLISSAEFQAEIRTAALFVCNQASLGGDLKVAPGACNDDGLLDVHCFRGTSRPALVRTLLAVKRGQTPSDAITFRSARITLEDLDGKSIDVFADGEVVTSANALEFDVHPGALLVYRFDAGAAADIQGAAPGLRQPLPPPAPSQELRI